MVILWVLYGYTMVRVRRKDENEHIHQVLRVTGSIAHAETHGGTSPRTKRLRTNIRGWKPERALLSGLYREHRRTQDTKKMRRTETCVWDKDSTR